MSLIVLLLIFGITAYLKFKNFQFKISDDAFILKQGIISKKLVEIKFKRIQNVHFEQNIIHQILIFTNLKLKLLGLIKKK
ncbi:MAG: PH domain-containing protein [Polaribacter sp.]|nr:PH domain-containing protein [Polaribacter sp.]